MEPVLDQALNDYLDGLQPDRPSYFREMEVYAKKRSFPIIGPQAGRLLYQYAALANPGRIFEMGSGFGYSACWLLAGAPRARMVCTDTSEENADRAREWMTQAGCWNRADFRVADALDALRDANESFDFIYNDVDKESYPDVFRLAMDRLSPGGLLISDNVLWSGRVADPSVQDPATRAIREYNSLMFETPRVQSLIIPIRDGLGVTLLEGRS